MINIAKLTYRAYAVLTDGRQLNITGALTAGGWNEGEGEISTRTTMTLANVKFDGKPLSSTIVPNTIIVITADAGGGEKEVARGYVTEWGPTRSSGGRSENARMASMTPSRHHSMVPAVVGETKRFCMMLCMISPATDRLPPVMMMLRSRGSRLISNTFIWAVSISSNPPGVISVTPVNTETTDRRMRKVHCKTRARGFRELWGLYVMHALYC